jgi:hypothetical protein
MSSELDWARLEEASRRLSFEPAPTWIGVSIGIVAHKFAATFRALRQT